MVKIFIPSMKVLSNKVLLAACTMVIMSYSKASQAEGANGAAGESLKKALKIIFLGMFSFHLNAAPPPSIDESRFDAKTTAALKKRYHEPFEEGNWKQGESWMGPGGYSMRNGTTIDPVTGESKKCGGGYCFGHAETIVSLLTRDWDPNTSTASGKVDPPRIQLSQGKYNNTDKPMEGYRDFKHFLQDSNNRQQTTDWARESLQDTQLNDGTHDTHASSPQENIQYVDELQKRLDLGLLPNLTFGVPGTELQHSVLLKEIKTNEDGSYTLRTLDSNMVDKIHEINIDSMGHVSSLGDYDSYEFIDCALYDVKRQVSKATIGIGNPQGWEKVLDRHAHKENHQKEAPLPVNGPINFEPPLH